MSDRADFLAGIAASGCGSIFGIDGDDFGTFDSPYPDPSPPGGIQGDLDHGMSDDELVSCDERSDPGIPLQVTKPTKSKKQKSKLSEAQKIDKKKEQRLSMVRKKQEVKMKRRIMASNHLPEESKKNLERIAKQARSEFGTSVEKKAEHVKWAAKTLNTAGYAYYLNLVDLDIEIQHELILLQRKEKPHRNKQSSL